MYCALGVIANAQINAGARESYLFQMFYEVKTLCHIPSVNVRREKYIFED